MTGKRTAPGDLEMGATFSLEAADPAPLVSGAIALGSLGVPVASLYPVSRAFARGSLGSLAGELVADPAPLVSGAIALGSLGDPVASLYPVSRAIARGSLGSLAGELVADPAPLVSGAIALGSLGDLCEGPTPYPPSDARLYPVSRAIARGSLGSLAGDRGEGVAGDLGASVPANSDSDDSDPESTPAAEQTLDEWRARLGLSLDKAFKPLNLGILLLQLCASSPGRLGEFHRQFPSMAMPTLAGGRFRDILPLPIPATPCLDKWRTLAAMRRTRRQARAQLVDNAETG